MHITRIRQIMHIMQAQIMHVMQIMQIVKTAHIMQIKFTKYKSANSGQNMRTPQMTLSEPCGSTATLEAAAKLGTLKFRVVG